MRTRTWSIRLKEWFPAEDPIAILIVKLLVLREDFLVELAGIMQGLGDTFQEAQFYRRSVEQNLDENSPGWRRLYFYRNSLKTLFEIRSEIEVFFKMPRGQSASANESEKFRALLQRLREKMTTASKTVERLQYRLGGHVSSGAIKSTLRDMHHDVSGFLQIGEIYGKTRYKFVGEIVMRMLLPGVPEAHVAENLDDLLKETAQLNSMFQTIDDLVGAYIIDRRLIT